MSEKSFEVTGRVIATVEIEVRREIRRIIVADDETLAKTIALRDAWQEVEDEYPVGDIVSRSSARVVARELTPEELDQIAAREETERMLEASEPLFPELFAATTELRSAVGEVVAPPLEAVVERIAAAADRVRETLDAGRRPSPGEDLTSRLIDAYVARDLERAERERDQTEGESGP